MKERSAREYYNGAYQNFMDVLGGLALGKRLGYNSRTLDDNRLRFFHFPQIKIISLQALVKALIVKEGLPDEVNRDRVNTLSQQIMEKDPEARGLINYAAGDLTVAMIITKLNNQYMTVKLFMSASPEDVLTMREKIRYEYSFLQLEELGEGAHA